jgi:hypothetical protein
MTSSISNDGRSIFRKCWEIMTTWDLHYDKSLLSNLGRKAQTNIYLEQKLTILLILKIWSTFVQKNWKLISNIIQKNKETNLISPELRFPESHFPELRFLESHFLEFRFRESLFPRISISELEKRGNEIRGNETRENEISQKYYFGEM